MAYVMSIERMARQEGRMEGGLFAERQLLLRQVRKRFGASAMDHSRPLLEAIADTGILEALGEGLLDCADREAWLAMLARAQPAAT